jgi:hypothetical protein
MNTRGSAFTNVVPTKAEDKGADIEQHQVREEVALA